MQQRGYRAPTIKQHLAAIRRLFDWLVTGQVMPTNPATSVRGPTHVVRTGKTPVLQPAEARLLLDTIGTYHGVSRAQLQVYLDEFAFRHNRRRTPMAAFQTLLGLGTTRAPTPLRRIRGGQDLSKPRDEDA